MHRVIKKSHIIGCIIVFTSMFLISCSSNDNQNKAINVINLNFNGEELQITKEEAEKLLSDLETLQADNSDLSSEKLDAENKNNDLTKKNESLVKKVEALNNKVDELQQENGDMVEYLKSNGITYPIPVKFGERLNLFDMDYYFKSDRIFKYTNFESNNGLIYGKALGILGEAYYELNGEYENISGSIAINNIFKGNPNVKGLIVISDENDNVLYRLTDITTRNLIEPFNFSVYGVQVLKISTSINTNYAESLFCLVDTFLY